ncbi:hypothetical protein [Alkalibacillus silvisoli]|uniref:Uncharacterized protein n=1 Tax=Alkalibacillus silvisoli TaxID=392823 RepID=A0ABN0ZV04_9BACI
MNLTFDRPFFGTTKFLNIKQGNYPTGKMRRWARPPKERPSSNLQYDVNIEVIGSGQTYDITQQSFSIREGYHWDVTENNRLLTTITSAKGLKEKHRVDYHFDETITLSIEASWSLKPEGTIFLDENEVGKTKAQGFITNRQYVIDFEPGDHHFDPNLVAGVVYAFWCSNNRG